MNREEAMENLRNHSSHMSSAKGTYPVHRG